MPRKVYIVETGEYSDRSIEGVFSSKKLAHKHCGDYSNIQEWIVDEQLQMKMRTVFVCTLDAETGNLIESHAAQANCSPWSSHSDAWREKAIGTSTRSARHAYKLAAEARQQFLREHPGIFAQQKRRKTGFDPEV